MHLGLRAPNIWFRARLRYADARAPGGQVDVAGFTLPGLPAVVVGSNGHVAWGFTNSYGDWLDWRARAGVQAASAPQRDAAACAPMQDDRGDDQGRRRAGSKPSTSRKPRGGRCCIDDANGDRLRCAGPRTCPARLNVEPDRIRARARPR